MCSRLILLTFRWYHGGFFDVSSGELTYVGGKFTEYMNIDVDRLPFFELRDYIKELGWSHCFIGDKKSFIAFNNGGDSGVQEGDEDVHCNEPETGAITKLVTTETVAATQLAETEPANSDFPKLGFDHYTDNSSELDHLDLFNEDEAEYDSDVNKDWFKSGFDETAATDKSLKNKINGDEPVYCSSDAFGVESDRNDERYEILRTNPGSTYVVKVDDSDGSGRE
ncbi:hypothetical protein HAX54_024552, partial [Datura stramonium]|nr:hypothetical protein [Datura stramonium]